MVARLERLLCLTLVMLTIAVASGCEGRAKISKADDDPAADEEREPRPGKLSTFDLTGGAPEAMGEGGLFGIPARRTFVGLVRSLERVREDEEVTGHYVKLGGSSLGFARAEEVGRELHELRETKKPVVCHAHSLSNSSAWMALRGCDRIWLSPTGDVDTVGIAGQVVYFKRLLDRFKVRADFLKMGRYKSFAETFTRDGPTEEARESLVGTLRSLRSSWLDDVEEVSGKKTREAMEQGPWTPAEAKDRGLIHAIGFESDALEDAKERANAGTTSVGFGRGAEASGAGIVELIRVMTGADEATGGRPHIAVLTLSGSITMAGGGLFSQGGISAQSLTKTLRRVAKDKSVEVVVLRIDSPGGSALASDLLWHELVELKKKKKVVASVGSMAASGGYYLAVAADKILAERTSIVGSIGVVGGKFSIGEALDEFGVSSETFPASPKEGAAARAAYVSPLLAWDDATRDRVRAHMQNAYDVFLSRVSDGRSMAVDDVKKHAEGRIWSGAQGKDRGLIDEIGGLGRAIEIARELGELDEEAPVIVEGGRETLMETLLLGEGASASEIDLALARYRARQPVGLELLAEPLRPYAGAVESLARGEKVLAVLPFALLVR